MKALTLHRPWDYAIAHGHKCVENRTWATAYRGPLLIHAGMKWDQAAADEVFLVSGVWLNERSWPGGRIVALVYVDGCRRRHNMPKIESTMPRGWIEGPWCWLLGRTHLLDPIPCSGSQRLWTPPQDVLHEVRRQLGNWMVDGLLAGPNVDPNWQDPEEMCDAED